MAGVNSSPEVSKFHRSFSMGHGWQNQFNNNVLRHADSESRGGGGGGEGSNGNSGQPDAVVKRRKNRSSCEEDIGSMLLCNPSINLRSLVPKEVLEVTPPNRADEHNGELLDGISFRSR